MRAKQKLIRFKNVLSESPANVVYVTKAKLPRNFCFERIIESIARWVSTLTFKRSFHVIFIDFFHCLSIQFSVSYNFTKTINRNIDNVANSIEKTSRNEKGVSWRFRYKRKIQNIHMEIWQHWKSFIKIKYEFNFNSLSI